MKHKFESRRQGVGNVVTGTEAKEDRGFCLSRRAGQVALLLSSEGQVRSLRKRHSAQDGQLGTQSRPSTREQEAREAREVPWGILHSPGP